MKKLSGKRIVRYMMMLALLAGFFVFGANAEEKVDLSAYDAGEAVSFEQALDSSNCIVKGEYVKRWTYEDYYEDEFTVKDVIKGGTDGAVIFVFGEMTNTETVCTDHEEPHGHAVYEAGEEYLLVLERWTNVYEEHDRYYAYNAVIPAGEYQAERGTSGDLTTSLDRIRKKRAAVEVSGGSYTDSADVQAIRNFADVTVLAEPVELFYESDIMDTQTYRCRVIDELQGEAEGKEIFMVVFKDTVQIGEQYVAMLMQADESSLVYTLAARENAILESEDTAARQLMTELR